MDITAQISGLDRIIDFENIDSKEEKKYTNSDIEALLDEIEKDIDKYLGWNFS